MEDSLRSPERMDLRISIPTREEHARKVRRLWLICSGIATAIFSASIITIIVMYARGCTTQEVWAIFGIAFPVCIASYGMAFFIPVMLTSTYRMWVGIEMSRRGLELADQTAKNLVDAENNLKRLQEEFDLLKKGDHAIIRTFKEEMALLRQEIRGRLEGEVDDALSQGEAEAEAILRGEKDPKPPEQG